MMPAPVPDDSTIAIVGMAVRVPGAESLEQFWANLIAGVESIERFGPDRRDRSLFDGGPTSRTTEGWVGAAGVLDGADEFDADFFGYSPRDAALLDPQHRVFLECAWHALEHAGYDPARAGAAGVFAGAGANSYIFNVVSQRALLAQVPPHQLLVSQDKDFLATRVSYHFGLSGPSIAIQTACSSSLVAVHVACQSLLARECDLALAGGVSIAAAQRAGYVPLQGAILSPDGRCRAFDADAAGTVPGNGAGVVVLKRYADAVRDRDTIHALILGSAINNDGRAKAGYTAPSADQQAAVIAEALAVARVEAAAIGYIEAHGTGTQLGDPIEVAALARVFPRRSDRSVCRIGSVKPNIGHLDVAAGVVGLIKAALAIRGGIIPPTLHFTLPNPRLELERTPFAVVSRATPWSEDARARCAGVSSFGIGGTNAHVVLAQVADVPAIDRSARANILALSARTSGALVASATRLAEYLSGPEPPHIDDVARTLALGRCPFSHRRGLVVRDRADAIAQLKKASTETAAAVPRSAPRIAFLFPGQGSQYARMGAGLVHVAPVYRDALAQCAELLHPAGVDLFDALTRDDCLRETAIAQPALFSVSWALTRQLAAWGVKPAGMLGHSLGEYVAACVAGVLSLADALALVAERGRLIAATPRGAMLAVSAGREVIEPLVAASCAIAAENAPEVTVVSGPEPAIDAIAVTLRERGIPSQRLATSHAFHGPLVDSILPQFRALVCRIALRPPERPFVSSSTGRPINADEATSPDYWVQQLRRPVMFAAALQRVAQDATVFLEVGPGRALTALVGRQLPRDRFRAIPVLNGAVGHEDSSALRAIASLWELGVPIDWEALMPASARRVPLPTYPFERRRYWVPLAEPGIAVSGEASAVVLGAASDGVASDGARDLAAGRSALVAPRTVTERVLAAIWGELLGISELGVDDDFFALRGDSLLATQVMLRIRSQFGVDLPLRAIFEAPTVARLAERLDQQPRSALPPAIARQLRGTRVPLSFAQQRLWFMHQMDPTSPAYNLTFAVRGRGPLDITSLGACVSEIVGRHEALRTVVVEDHGRPVGLVRDGGAVAIEVEQVAGIDVAQQRAAEDTLKPFDLSRGPLIRLRVLVLGAADHVLVFSVHHIAFDVWSCAVFVRELLALYDARTSGRSPSLPELGIQYADYAAWQSEHLDDAVCAREVAHWRRILGASPPRVAPPPDRDVVPCTAAGAGYVAYVSPALTARLLDLARVSSATLFAPLMAAYALLLRHRTGHGDLVIGTDVANRTRVEVEPLIGFFVNQLALRVEMGDLATAAQVIARVHEVAMTAFAHQDVPFDKVVAGLNPSRDCRRSPLFDTKFVLRNVRFPALCAGGVAFEVLDLERRTAAFDFVLTCAEVDDRLRLEVEYATERYNTCTIERFLADYELLLGAIADCPDTLISELFAALDAAASRRRAAATERAHAAAAASLRELVEPYPSQADARREDR